MLVESRKFIPLMYQLAARLGSKNQNGLFQILISKVLITVYCKVSCCDVQQE